MGILKGVSGRVLDCGCLVGVYETYSGETVRVIDAVGESCPRHRKGETIANPADRQADEPDATV